MRRERYTETQALVFSLGTAIHYTNTLDHGGPFLFLDRLTHTYTPLSFYFFFVSFIKKNEGCHIGGAWDVYNYVDGTGALGSEGAQGGLRDVRGIHSVEGGRACVAPVELEYLILLVPEMSLSSRTFPVAYELGIRSD